MANLVWADPASQATHGLEFWTGTQGAAVESSIVKYGIRSTKIGPADGSYAYKAGVGADAGRRVTGWFRIASLPADQEVHLHIFQTTGSLPVLILNITTAGVLQLSNEETGGSVKNSSGAALVVDTWYRIALSYAIAATNNWDARVYVDGALFITASEADFNLSRVGGVDYVAFYTGALESVTAYVSPIVIDDGADLADPGDLRCIHAPYAAENTNSFDTAIGAARDASDYTNVNERPLSETNGWQHAAASIVEESYIIEQTLSVLDVNLTGKTIVGRMAWIWAKGGTSTVQLINNGVDVPKTLTTVSALYTDITTSATYPTGAFGMKSSGTADDTFFYEGGCLIVWLESEAPVTGPAVQVFMHQYIQRRG